MVWQNATRYLANLDKPDKKMWHTFVTTISALVYAQSIFTKNHNEKDYKCPDKTHLVNSINYYPAPKYLENKMIKVQNKNVIQYSIIKCSWYKCCSNKNKELFYTNLGKKESEKVWRKNTMFNRQTSEILI